jgi:hypothetical protein
VQREIDSKVKQLVHLSILVTLLCSGTLLAQVLRGDFSADNTGFTVYTFVKGSANRAAQHEQ